MGIISIVKANNLLWLGRYTERTYTTLRLFNQYYDQMIDFDPAAYQKYCEKLGIPDVYGDKNTFSRNYIFDAADTNSMVSNLTRAHDNAIVIRDTISSETLSYLEMALNILKEGYKEHAPLLEMQKVLDYLMAFWGCMDDYVDDEESRNVIKVGRYQERLDLYFRFSMPYDKKLKEYSKLSNRLNKSHLQYKRESMLHLLDIIDADSDEQISRFDAISCINHLLEERF